MIIRRKKKKLWRAYRSCFLFLLWGSQFASCVRNHFLFLYIISYSYEEGVLLKNRSSPARGRGQGRQEGACSPGTCSRGRSCHRAMLLFPAPSAACKCSTWLLLFLAGEETPNTKSCSPSRSVSLVATVVPSMRASYLKMPLCGFPATASQGGKTSSPASPFSSDFQFL